VSLSRGIALSAPHPTGTASSNTAAAALYEQETTVMSPVEAATPEEDIPVVTVKELRKRSNVPYVTTYASSSQAALGCGGMIKAEVDVRDLIGGAEIRDWLVEDDADALWGYIAELTQSREFVRLSEMISRREVTVLVKKLVELQANDLFKVRELQAWRQDDGGEVEALQGELKIKAKQVSQLLKGLYSIPEFEWCKVEVDWILKLLIMNREFFDASIWIKFVEVDGKERGFRPSLKYQGYKMQVSGGTSPLRWNFSGGGGSGVGGHIDHKSYRSSVVMSQPWEKLIRDFPHAEAVPNIETHTEFISGFSRNGDLQQVKDYIYQIWGLKEDGTTPEHVVERSSTLYPTSKLIQRLIMVFSYHGQVDQVMGYLESFDRYYGLDLDRHPVIWKTLIEQLMHSGREKEEIVETFRNLWKLMVHRKVKLSVMLLKLKLKILKGSAYESELVEDLPMIHSRYRLQRTEHGYLKLEDLMTGYLECAIAVIYKEDIESDDAVNKLLMEYSFNAQQMQSVALKSTGIKKMVMLQKDRFDQLQKQYDEEDEEDALW
jgi:hypothetical protein